MLKAKIAGGDNSGPIEYLRKGLVLGMRQGSTFVLGIGKMTPDFYGEFNTPEFPAKEIFQHDVWRKRDNYMKIVKPDENVDHFGNPDQYVLDEKFQFIILAEYVSDDETKNVLEKIPHSNLMTKVLIS